MPPNMARYARETDARTLPDVLAGADVFLGLSAPRRAEARVAASLAPKPLILALANPDPEITPEAARAARPDAIVATGRSDYPNQVNNVLCFPFIFRGALDVGAREINEAMKIACVEAIAELARAEASEVVAAAYGGHAPVFGPEYIIPKPFDPRLILQIAPAVARAAMESGVAERPIADLAAYRHELERFVFRSGQLMRPVFEAARRARSRIVYAEGEDERVLRAVQTVVDDGLAEPILIGRRAVIERGCARWGCGSTWTTRCGCWTAGRPDVFAPLSSATSALVGRRGTPPDARRAARADAAHRAAAHAAAGGQADAALCGGPATGGGTSSTSCRSSRAPRGRAGVRALLPDPAVGRAVLLRHPRERRAHGGAGGRDDAAGGRGGARLRRRARRRRCCRTPRSAPRTRPPRGGCATRWR